MKVRCPKCGSWCSSEKANFLERGLAGYRQTDELAGKFGRAIGGDLGEIVARIYSPNILGGGYEAIFGESYKFECKNCGHKWCDDEKIQDQYREYTHECEIEKLIETASQYTSKSEYEKRKYVDKLESELSQLSENASKFFKAKMYNALAYAYYILLNDKRKASFYIEKSLTLVDDFNSTALKGIIRGNVESPLDNYLKLRELICYKKAKQENPFFSKDEFQKYVDETCEKYASHFLEIPSMKRRFLVIDDSLNYLPDSFKVISSDFLPKSLGFPSGHPVEKVLYICHPFNDSYYIPFEGYQFELFRDELDEFGYFLHALGAESIEITDGLYVKKNDRTKKDIEGNLGGGYNGVKGNLNYEDKNSKESYDELIKNLKQYIKSEKIRKPHVPKDLMWYNHRPEWKTIEKRRMLGLTNFVHHISNASDVSISTNELKQLSLDFNTLVASGNVGLKVDEQKEFRIAEKHEWKIDVKFYPLSSYENLDLK